MRNWRVNMMTSMALAACSQSKDKSAEPDKSTEPTSAESAKVAEPAATSDCQEETGEAMFQAWKASLLAYKSLEYPIAEAECEALRLFTIDVAPIAQAFHANMQEFKQWSQARSDECRAQSKEKYGGQMTALMAELEKDLGPQITGWELQVRACKEHPGMAEAFDAVSFKAAK